MAESELARRALAAAMRYPEPGHTGPPGRHRAVPGIGLSALGRSECVMSIGSRTLRLSPRHSEILIILAVCPAGLTGDELAYLLYPDGPAGLSGPMTCPRPGPGRSCAGSCATSRKTASQAT